MNQEMRWSCGPDEAVGINVLEIARPGLILLPDHPVEQAIFHDWLFQCAERLLQAHIGYGHLEDHEAEWLANGLALAARAHEVEDREEIRIGSLMIMASLNTFSVIRSSPREMGSIYEWTGDFLSWATKSQHGDRWCEHDPVSLAKRAIEITRQLAERQGEDGEAATEAERRAQYESLLDLV